MRPIRLSMFKRERRGKSYAKRVADINQIYDVYSRTGLSNREIWRRYVYPKYGCNERTFYNMLKASGKLRLETINELAAQGFLFPELLYPKNDVMNPDYWKKTE